MTLNDNEIWKRIIELEGKELFTYVENKKNTIIRVENNQRLYDQIIISERNTYPTKEDVIAAYNLFIIQGRLKRIPDLQWLAKPEKKVSSIVFRIIGEISADHSQIDYSRKEPVLIHKNQIS